MDDFEARFWEKVDIWGACWLWTAALFPEGYGMVWNPDLRRPEQAHRVAYRLAHGEIPAGRDVVHLCGTLACVRDDHLAALTPAQRAALVLARGLSRDAAGRWRAA